MYVFRLLSSIIMVLYFKYMLVKSNVFNAHAGTSLFLCRLQTWLRDRQSMLPHMCVCVFLSVRLEGGQSLSKPNPLILGTHCPQRESKKQQAQLSLTMDLPPHQPELKRLHSVPRLSLVLLPGKPARTCFHSSQTCLSLFWTSLGVYQAHVHIVTQNAVPQGCVFVRRMHKTVIMQLQELKKKQTVISFSNNI